jgi:hypothetical protein
MPTLPSMSDDKRSRLKWLWRYANLDGGNPVAQGKLFTKAKPSKDGFYTVTDIKGKRDGVRIQELLPAGTGIPGNVDSITGKPYLGDNKIRPQSLTGDRGQLTDGGIVFSLKDGTYSNLFYPDYLANPTHYEFHTAPPFPAGLTPPNSQSLLNFEAWITHVS